MCVLYTPNVWGTDLTKMIEQFFLLTYLAAAEPSVSHLNR
jgi:hypothetical protein